MRIGFTLYHFLLALWVGGMAMFSFLVTPVIFTSFTRDTAGEIVGKLFPYYFPFTLVTALLALIVFLFFIGVKATVQHRITLALLLFALLVNVFVAFKLYPDITRVKQEIATFAETSSSNPKRLEFKKLHRMSSILNILLLLDGTVLLFISNSLKK
jgi:hypothetical protein